MSDNRNQVAENKKLLRNEIRQRFRSLPPEQIKLSGRLILENLVSLDEWKNSDIVLAFISMKDEADTSAIIGAALSAGKKTAVPRIEGNEIGFRCITSRSMGGGRAGETFVRHSYGMYEPDESLPPVGREELENSRVLALVPGLAFDRNCARLGRGKSFYDRFLAGCGRNVIRAGIALDFQVVDSVPVEEHDEKMDMVVTEKAVYKKQS